MKITNSQKKRFWKLIREGRVTEESFEKFLFFIRNMRFNTVRASMRPDRLFKIQLKTEVSDFLSQLRSLDTELYTKKGLKRERLLEIETGLRSISLKFGIEILK